MKPTVGRSVHYRLTMMDATNINKRREDAKDNLEKMREDRPGFQAHIGNMVAEGENFAMMVVKVWEGTKVNGQVFLDGNDVLWVIAVREGVALGQWHWPPRADQPPRPKLGLRRSKVETEE